ncbi:hypothetical protein EVAR_30382_1 [Eumeta japonica]|uniref:Uncharacterized protein n=1 Tax=Eumeta variegata TaxID=151549 RepID=A0A4C1W5G9_EUMVA|nr:hypothetical protein EVAR_30382_1 [Eumeta japonica]
MTLRQEPRRPGPSSPLTVKTSSHARAHAPIAFHIRLESKIHPSILLRRASNLVRLTATTRRPPSHRRSRDEPQTIMRPSENFNVRHSETARPVSDFRQETVRRTT